MKTRNADATRSNSKGADREAFMKTCLSDQEWRELRAGTSNKSGGLSEKILAHLGLPLAPPSPAPARSAAWLSDWPD